MSGWYYLHENGELIYKPDYDGAVGDFRESNLVYCFWRVDETDRETAWTILVEGLARGATRTRVMELADRWKCDEADAELYANRIRARLFKDGDQWCAARHDFKNQQESPCGFGEHPIDAFADLARALNFTPTKLGWHATFKELLKR